MRILHVVPTYYPAVRYGGPIVAVHGLCRALAARGHELLVFTTNVDGPGITDTPVATPVNLDGVQIRYFPCPLLRRLYWSPALSQALRREIGNFRLVHLHSVFLWPTWAAARVARNVGVPYVLSPRGMLVKDLIARRSRLVKSAWIRLIERANVEQAAVLHLTSQLESTELAYFGWRLPRVAVIPNAVDEPLPPNARSRRSVGSMRHLRSTCASSTRTSIPQRGCAIVSESASARPGATDCSISRSSTRCVLITVLGVRTTRTSSLASSSSISGSVSM